MSAALLWCNCCLLY